jgi:hypothetical protein
VDIFSYTIDIQIDDASEVAFTSATQLACADLGGGLCFASPFTLDPADGLGEGGTYGRASRVSTDPLYIDGRRNFPAGTDGPVGLFALTFTVLDVVIDGSADITIGFLNDEGFNGVTGIGDSGEPFDVLPDPDRVSFSVIPEPRTLLLMLCGLLGLASIRAHPAGN